MIIKLMETRGGGLLHNKEQWKKQFSCGSLMPDAVEKNQKRYSHFWNEKDLSNVIITPDIDRFLEKYQMDLENPLLCGYFSHLFLDVCFYRDFLEKYVSFYNANNCAEAVASKISYVKVHKNKKRVSLDTFFSEEYLYGDYTKLNKFFLDKYQFPVTWNIDMEKPPIKEVKTCDLKLISKELEHFLNQETDGTGGCMVLEKNELDLFLEGVADEIVDYLMKN